MTTKQLDLFLFCWPFLPQVDNQLIGTTQPFMLYVTPLSNENEVIETGPAVQVNAVKFPSKSALTNIYKVGWQGGWGRWHVEAHLLSHSKVTGQATAVCAQRWLSGLSHEGNVRSTFSWHSLSLVVVSVPLELNLGSY